MPVRFNADEIFQMAERLEQNAATYYHTAAEKVNYPGARQMFLELASWEEKHESNFASMHKNISDKEREEMAFDPYDETAQYLQALADESIFDTSDSPLENIGTEPTFENILRFAVSKEKDTINFYTGLRQLVSAGSGKNKVDEIIQEEMRHVSLLTQELNKVKTE